MTMYELNRPSDDARGDVIRYEASVNCEKKGEVSDGIL